MKRLLAFILILIMISGFAVLSFADYDEHEDSGPWDFSLSYNTYGDWPDMTRIYEPYNTLYGGYSFAVTVLNNVNTDYDVHDTYVLLYSSDNTQDASWSSEIQSGHVYSGSANSGYNQYAKRVIHYSEKSYDIYQYDTYRYTYY